MTVISALGGGEEFDRIRAIAAALGRSASGLGDDAAALPSVEGELVVSTDVSVEGVHFRREWLTPQEIGWRAASAALSDLAAMGAHTVGVVVALTLPRGSADELAIACMQGVGDAVLSAGGVVLGGDLSGGPALSLAVTVIGHCARPVWRHGARPGDRLWVTGVLGGARAGLLALERGGEVPRGARLAFAHPIPRLAAGRWLAAEGATAMLDVSDGVAGDALHLGAASGVHLEIDLRALPIHPSVHRLATSLGEAAPEFAAVGGEEYELLVTMPADWTPTRDPDAWTGVGLTAIGRVGEGAGVAFLLDGVPRSLQGFRHQ